MGHRSLGSNFIRANVLLVQLDLRWVMVQAYSDQNGFK